MKNKIYSIRGILLYNGRRTIIQCHVSTKFKFLAKRLGRKILEERYQKQIKDGGKIIINKPPIFRRTIPKGVKL